MPTKKELLGIPISLCRFEEAVETILGWFSKRELHNQVIVANVHLVTEAQHNKNLKAAFDGASLALTDGMPLVWLAKKYYPNAERVVGVDLMHALCAKGLRIFLLGGAEGIAESLGKKLSAQYQNMQLVGTACPPFRPQTKEEETALIAQINAAHPDIVFVALGAPKQELWIHQHKNVLDVPALIGVGAAFDYALGRLQRAPRWMQAAGLEWFYRFLQEPRRLFKRYLFSNSYFIWLVLCQYLGLRRSAK